MIFDVQSFAIGLGTGASVYGFVKLVRLERKVEAAAQSVPPPESRHSVWPDCSHCGKQVAKYKHDRIQNVVTCANCERERG